MEKQDAANLDDCSEENRLLPLEAYQGYSRRSALWGKAPLLLRSGNAVGRWMGNLTVGPCE